MVKCSLCEKKIYRGLDLCLRAQICRFRKEHGKAEYEKEFQMERNPYAASSIFYI